MTPYALYSEVEHQGQQDPIVQHAPLVRRIARHLMGRLPREVQFDDLMQAGMMGLLEAVRQYKPSHGASFTTYATIRIRGAMIDELRRLDWTPRSVHRKAREASEVIRALETRLGREARDSEIADALGMSIEEYHHILQDVSTSRLFSFDVEDPETGAGIDLAAAVDDPSTALQKEEFHEALATAIRGLPERDQLIMSLYYDEELNLREIGEILGVSESRVSQLLGRVMLRLRSALGEWVD